MATIVKKKDQKRGGSQCVVGNRAIVPLVESAVCSGQQYEHKELRCSLFSTSIRISSGFCIRLLRTKNNKTSNCTHDVRLEVLVEMHRIHGLLDHGVDLVVADMNLAHRE